MYKDILKGNKDSDTIKCPHCGRYNVRGIDICSNCRYRFNRKNRFTQPTPRLNELFRFLVIRFLIPLVIIAIGTLFMRK